MDEKKLKRIVKKYSPSSIMRDDNDVVSLEFNEENVKICLEINHDGWEKTIFLGGKVIAAEEYRWGGGSPKFSFVDKNSFDKFLENASKTVSSWPSWKQELLGGKSKNKG